MGRKALYIALLAILAGIIIFGVSHRLVNKENLAEEVLIKESPSSFCMNFEKLLANTAEAYTRITKKTQIPWEGKSFFVSYQGNIPMFLVAIKASSWKEYNRILPETADFFIERGENPCKLYIVWTTQEILGPSREPIIGIPCFEGPEGP